MSKKGQSDLDRRVSAQSAGEGLWDVLLTTVYSMLNSADYLRSLSPYQVCMLTSAKIRSLGRKVGYLSVDGIRFWQDNQLSSLTINQLLTLDAERTVVVAAHCSPSCIKRWILDAERPMVVDQLKFILDGINGNPAKLRAIGEALNKKKEVGLAVRLLMEAIEQLSDDSFRQVVVELSDERLSELILSDISMDLSGDPVFRSHIEKEFAKFVKGRTHYEQRLKLFDRSIGELNRFERRLVFAQHHNIREKIYSELQEWLSELPLAGLPQLLLPWGRISRLPSRQAQNEVLQETVKELKAAVDSERESFEGQHGLRWRSLKELKAAWSRVKKQIRDVEKHLFATVKKLQNVEEKLRPTAQKLNEGDFGGDSLKQVDRYINHVQGLLKKFDEEAVALADVLENAQMITAGVEYLLEQRRFIEEPGSEGDEYVGALPMALFKKLISLSLYDPKEEASQQAVTDFICGHKPLMRFREYCELYAEVITSCHLLERLLDQLHTLEYQKEPIREFGDFDVLLRCKKKVEAWEFFKLQTFEYKDQDSEQSS